MINQPIQYLIVLKNIESKIRKQINKKFTKIKNKKNFNIKILFENELIKNNIIIKNILLYDTLYVKLPKQKIWTTHKEWISDYLNEQMNELIKVFRSFNAKSIKYTITKNTETNNNFTGEIGCFGKGFKGKNESDNLHNTKLEYNINYDKRIHDRYLNKNIFDALYLTKENNRLTVFQKEI